MEEGVAVGSLPKLVADDALQGKIMLAWDDKVTIPMEWNNICKENFVNRSVQPLSSRLA